MSRISVQLFLDELLAALSRLFAAAKCPPSPSPCKQTTNQSNLLREPLKIHFGGQAVPNGYFYLVNAAYYAKSTIDCKGLPDLAVRRALFDSGRRQKKQALASAKPDFPSLPEYKNILLAAQKQLLELPFKYNMPPIPCATSSMAALNHKYSN